MPLATKSFVFFSALLWLATGINGQLNQLTSANPSSCGNFTGLTVTNIEFKYHRFNSTLEYILVANAQQPSLSPVLRIDVSMYGKSAPPQVIHLCDHGITDCPMPPTDVTFQGSRILDQPYVQNLPSFVWTLPDLEADATFVFFAGPDEVIGCVRTGISNGVTANSSVVPWITGTIAIGLALIAGLIAGLTSANSLRLRAHVIDGARAGAKKHSGQNRSDTSHDPHEPSDHSSTAQDPAGGGESRPPVDRLDPLALFLHFQFISTTGLLALKLPPMYQSFTANFAWANFIIPIKPLRATATRMRKCNLVPQSSSASNIPGVNSELSMAASKLGISAYAAKLKFHPQDIFGIAYFGFLSVSASLLVLFIVVTSALQISSWLAKDPERKEVWLGRRIRWQQMTSNNVLRLMNLALGTLATFAFFQWTQKCTSPATIFASASALALSLGSLGTVSFLIVRLASRPGGVEQLFNENSTYARRWGTLYDIFDDRRLNFLGPLLALVVARSAVVGFGQDSGLTQVVSMIVVESVTCLSFAIARPYYSRGYNRVSYMLQGTRIISHVLLLPFTNRFKPDPITGYVLGIVLMVINSTVGFVLLVLTVLKLGWGILWYRKRNVAFEKKKALQKKNRTSSFAAADSYGGGFPSELTLRNWRPSIDRQPPTDSDLIPILYSSSQPSEQSSYTKAGTNPLSYGSTKTSRSIFPADVEALPKHPGRLPGAPPRVVWRTPSSSIASRSALDDLIQNMGHFSPSTPSRF